MKPKSRILYAISVILFGLNFLILAFPQQVHAQGEQFALYVGSTPEQKKAIADNWNKNDDSYDAAGWKDMKIVATGGLFGSAGQVLPFNAQDTKEIACNGGCESREPIFTIQYYCKPSQPGNILFQRPPDNEEYFRIQFAVALHDNGQNGDEFVARKTYNGFSGLLRVQQNSVTDNGYGRETLKYDITQGGNRPQDMPNGDNSNQPSTDKFGIPDQYKACRPSGEAASSLSNIRNWASLSDAEKARFPSLSSINSASSSGGTDSATDEKPNCENTGSVLGFFMCPVIEGMAGVSDWVFDTFIKGFLVNVPVSTDTTDAGYKAWQSFRIIGNVVLIGALLAVVYYQARGGN